MKLSCQQLVTLNLLILHEEGIEESWYSFNASGGTLAGQNCLQHIKQQPGGAQISC